MIKRLKTADAVVLRVKERLLLGLRGATPRRSRRTSGFSTGRPWSLFEVLTESWKTERLTGAKGPYKIQIMENYKEKTWNEVELQDTLRKRSLGF